MIWQKETVLVWQCTLHYSAGRYVDQTYRTGGCSDEHDGDVWIHS